MPKPETSAALPASAAAKLRELDGADCSRKVARRIRALIEAGSDLDCYKINAFRIAEELKVPRRDSLRAFLFATRLGLLDMHYDVHCPSCYGVPEFHKHLMGLRDTSHCPLCEIDLDVDFERQVEVTFTPNPEVRAIRYRHFKDRNLADKRLRDFNSYFYDVLPREGRLRVIGDCFEPGETRAFSGRLEAGRYRYAVPAHLDKSVAMTVAGPPVRQPQKVAVTVREDGSLSKVPARLRPGPIELTVRYGYPRFWGFALRSDEPLKNWVSALHVTSQQDFRDLFAGEFLAPDVSFAIRSVTLMFTDIKASTEMYERLGDSRAYAVVQDHFRVMTGVIRAREGAVVKTIGDAVMASFPASRDAAAAAREIQEAFARSSIRGLRVEVKIGLHRGPVIAVTSNRALDFFGRAVNVAARVQGESSAGEVLATDAVLADPEAARRLSGRGARARAFTASLKGVRGGVRLRAFRFARGRARA